MLPETIGALVKIATGSPKRGIGRKFRPEQYDRPELKALALQIQRMQGEIDWRDEMITRQADEINALREGGK